MSPTPSSIVCDWRRSPLRRCNVTVAAGVALALSVLPRLAMAQAVTVLL